MHAALPSSSFYSTFFLLSSAFALIYVRPMLVRNERAKRIEIIIMMKHILHLVGNSMLDVGISHFYGFIYEYELCAYAIDFRAMQSVMMYATNEMSALIRVR